MQHIKANMLADDFALKSMFYCPQGKTHYTCFFSWLQKKPTNEKIKWYQRLTAKDKIELMRCHNTCNENTFMNLNKLNYIQVN